MNISENIKHYRTKLHLSQEYVADQLGISRQAVSKWETGQSQPTAQNLADLAMLFEISISELVEPERNKEEVSKAIKAKEKVGYKTALIILDIFLAYYLIWLIIGNKDMNSTMLAIIRMRNSRFYLFPWLVRNNLYWIAVLISSIGALLSKKLFSYATCFGTMIGILFGELFGPNPDSPTGHTHNGWWMWILIFLLSIIIGIILEIRKKHRSDMNYGD